MARPGAWRPGDRSRREDDRYLFLEALLSARDALHIGWVGRSARDNAERAPSVLVGQLRDYLAAAWRDAEGGKLLHRLTVEHPLQPFSPAYFRAGDDRLFTFANEWRHVHDGAAATAGDSLPPWSADRPIGLATLRRFLRHPVREFFQARLGVRFELPDVASETLEPFALDGLDRYTMTDSVLRAALRETQSSGMAITAATARLQRSGMLPMGGFAGPVRRELEEGAAAVYGRYVAERRRWPVEAEKYEVRLAIEGIRIEDWLAGLRANADGVLAALLVSPSGVLDAEGHPLAHRVVMPWVDHLVAQAAGFAVETRYIGPDGTIVMEPMERDVAVDALGMLLRAWRTGMSRPLPVAMKTALAWIAAGDEEAAEAAARRAYAPADEFTRGEVDGDAYLARAWPDFDAMLAAGFANQLGPYRILCSALKVEQA